MFTPKDFQDNGFVEYPIHNYNRDHYKLADKFFTKKIIQDNEILFYIFSYYYDFTGKRTSYPIGVTFECHFKLSEDREIIVSISNSSFKNLQEVEEFLLNRFRINECISYGEL